MKKITFLLLTLFFSAIGFSQGLPQEGFESTSGPEPLPSTIWSLGTGDWLVFDNGVSGAAQRRWGISDIAWQGINAAYIDRPTTFADNQTVEEYLVTPEFTVPTNGLVQFWTRGFLAGSQGTIYQIKIADASADPEDPNSFLFVKQWTDADLVNPITQYDRQTADLSDYEGMNVRIAFVLIQAPITAPFGDRWFIDDVSVVERCFDPSNLTATGITHAEALLNWTASGSSSWEVEVYPATGSPTGTGTVYSGTLPFQATTITSNGVSLDQNTAYKYRVRVVCPNSLSDWVEGEFTTLRTGLACNAPITISSLPYTTTDHTGNYADNYDISQMTACAGTVTNFMQGNDVFYTYTPTADGTINIRLTPSATHSGIFVYATCPGTGVACVDGVANTNNNIRNLNVQVTAGVQYIIVLSSSNTTQTYGYTLVIQETFCTAPAMPTVNGITQTGANFSWAAGTATAWEVFVQAEGLPVPSVAGALTTINTDSPSPIVLTPNTSYDMYVRADCGTGGNMSSWIGPLNFRTLCDGFSVPFQEGFNSNSDSEPCWSVINGNNDGNTWNMSYDQNPFEGNQVASISTSTGVNNNDWLISPQIVLDGNQRLKYRYRAGSATTQGSFRVVLSTGGTAQADFTEILVPTTAYTNVTYIERIVNLSAYTGAVRIAWHVPQGSQGGNRLYVDNVIIEDLPTCPEPSALTVDAVLHNSVELSWQNGGSETEWQILHLPCGSPAPTLGTTGWVTADTNPYPLGGLTPLTCYDVYIRAVCDNNDLSPWAAEKVTFTTQIAPPECGGNFVDEGGPNGNYPANSNWTQTICAGAGQLVTVTFTSFNTETNWDGLYVYDGNSTSAPQIPSTNGAGNGGLTLPGAFWGTALPGPFTSSLPGGCLTFNFINDGLVQYSGWIANVTCVAAPPCTKPNTVTVNSVLTTTAQVSWNQIANPDTTIPTAWEVLLLPCDSPAPGANVTGALSAGTSINFPLDDLTPNTCYDVYVRALCSPEFSEWSAKTTFRTQCVAFPIPFQEGFNSNSDSESCWTVLNLNNDADSWNMNYATNPFEGNQCASILTDGNGTGANNNNDWLISPQIEGLNGNQRLRYRYRVQTAGEPNSFRVMLSNGGNAPDDFTTILVPLANYTNTTYLENIVPLTEITGTINIGFHIPPSGPDGNRLYIDKVIVEDIPTCLEPINLQVLNTTATTAYLGWTDTNTPPAGKWEILALPAPVAGDPLPSLPVNQNYTVTTNPAYITGLEPSTAYTYYVRALCSDDDRSVWSAGANFSTKPGNDECVDAQFVPVNSSQVCEQVVSGVVTGAGPSTGVPFTCIGTPDDDVWYQFVATNSYLSVSLRDVVGTTNNLNFAVYSGSCGTLTQFACSNNVTPSPSVVLNNLVVGNLYYIRVYSNSSQPQTASFNICITTPSTCSNAATVCSITYGNTVGVTTLGQIGCLYDSKNPTFFTIQVTETGPINYLLTQSSVQGGPANLDVDYAAWGPFTSQAAACSAINLPGGGFLTPGIGVPVTQQTGCSYNPASTETLNIANAQAGQFYIILITNYSNQPGYISLNQTNAAQPGAGQTMCCPDANFVYNKTTFCKIVGEGNPVVTIAQNSLAGAFSAYPNGLVFVDDATGEVDLMASAPGYYQVTNTLAPTTDCIEKKYYYFIRITEQQSATITYSANEACSNDTATTLYATVSGTNGTFAVIPQGGLYINPITGDITPSLSSAGTYTVSYNLPDNGSCPPSESNSTTIVIKPAPNVVTPGDLVVCDSYELPELTVGNYYTGIDGTGTLITLPHTITETQTLYVYANNNNCIDQKSFTVTVNKVPTPDATTTQSACAAPTGTVTVTSPIGEPNLPPDLFISEVTDHNTGSLTYVELYNGTGAAVDLANYKLHFYTFGVNPTPGTIPNHACDLTLSGTLANNATIVIKVSNSVNQGGVVPDLVFTDCSGVNNNDYIKLTTSADVDIDLWGKTDGSVFTPAGQTGYTYRRINTASFPSMTWNPDDWEAIDPQDYTDVGSYSLPLSGYQYSLDGGEYQTGTTFTSVAAGNHTVVAQDLVTGCYSAPFNVIVMPTSLTSSDVAFSYTTPICKNATTNPIPTPINPATFAANGTYAEDTTFSTGLDISAITGEINLAGSTAGTHRVVYTVPDDLVTCIAGGSFSFDITIKAVVTPVVGFGYNQLTVCESAEGTLNPIYDAGFNATGQFTVTPSTGLSISSTGVISLGGASVSGTYNIVYSVNADADNCQVANTSATVQVVINPVITPTFGTIDTVICFGDTINSLPTPSSNGITGTWSPALNNTATTEYTFTPDAGQCATVPPKVTIEVLPLPEFTVTQGCIGNDYTLTAVETNSSNPGYAWFDASNTQIGTSQSVVVTSAGTYKLVITQNGCGEEETVVVADVLCSQNIQKGISANGDGYNDNFELSNLSVKRLEIFNRYGMKVYSKGNYTNEWYGQSDKGDELPDGTYYYVIHRNNGENITGWIYITREQ